MLIFIIIKKIFFPRFDQVFMVVLEQLQPLCVSEEKFCTTFFHFPRAEETRGVSEGGREGGCMCKVGNNCDKIIFHVIVKYCLIKIILYYSIFIFSL